VTDFGKVVEMPNPVRLPIVTGVELHHCPRCGDLSALEYRCFVCGGLMARGAIPKRKVPDPSSYRTFFGS
jgi:hypothetical protein